MPAVAPAPSSAAGADQDLRSQQWGLTQIDAPGAWSHSTGTGVAIGVVDTGIDPDQPALRGAIDLTATCLKGRCVDGTAPDRIGHGTAVASVAAARRDGNTGFAGVAPDARLIVAKALDDRGTGDVEDIANAIRWVVDHGAKVVNLSLGDDNIVLVSRSGTDLKPAIEYAWTRGAIPVIASGNYNAALGDNLSANYGNLDAVVVGATNELGVASWYSAPLGNAKWGVLAPGGAADHVPSHDVLVAVPGSSFKTEAGTSFAAPHVSGVLALLLAQGMTPDQAIQRVLATADAGRVEAAVAVKVAAAAPPTRRVRSARGGHHVPWSITVLALAAALAAAGAVVRTRRAGGCGGAARSS